jgi:hypothetical protein
MAASDLGFWMSNWSIRASQQIFGMFV